LAFNNYAQLAVSTRTELEKKIRQDVEKGIPKLEQQVKGH
jgi:hypothetical protein